MKYLIILVSLFLMGCGTYPVYSTPKPNTGRVVNWSPNPNICHMNREFQGTYWYGCYFPKVGVPTSCGVKGWEKGFDYPYEY
jgi:hypothetical protein